MAFIETADWKERINISEIVKLSERAHGKAVAELRDGTMVGLGPRFSLVAEAACPVLPAHPGFELLIYHWGSDQVTYERQPILGWRVTPYGPEPIVIDTIDELANYAIKVPDGQIFMPREGGGIAFDSEAVWRADREEDFRERRQEAAKPKAVT